MKHKILIALLVFGVLVLSGLGFFLATSKGSPSVKQYLTSKTPKRKATQGEVIGFLPYWLISKADLDYSQYITNLTYFSLSVNEDGTIQQFVNPGEYEPGYYALINGKADEHLKNAKVKGLTLSISVFSGDDKTIESMLKDPEQSAMNLISQTQEIMQKNGFTELNLDIEYVGEATPQLRQKYAEFVKNVRENRNGEIIKVLSIDVSASSFVKETNLINPPLIIPLVDKIIIMAYDFHYTGSFVTGPVAPGEGAGKVSEFDTQTALATALNITTPEKIILGVPTYGYEWESIGDNPRSAVIPTTGMIISNFRAEEFLSSCASCSAIFDETDKEKHIIYKDQKTDTYHQIFYPDEQAMYYKVEQAENYNLDGIAVWALGYEGETILKPLSSYRN